MTIQIKFRNRSFFRQAQAALSSERLATEVSRNISVIWWLYIKRRFIRLSRSGGGGEWPPLAESTILARRLGRRSGTGKTQGRGGRKRTRAKQLTIERRKLRRAKSETQIRKVKSRIANLLSHKGTAILVDTGTLNAALDLNSPGNFVQNIPKGVRIGFSGATGHPSGKATIAEIASLHQLGGPDLPQRTILVPPDRPTERRMITVFQRTVRGSFSGKIPRRRRRGR